MPAHHRWSLGGKSCYACLLRATAAAADAHFDCIDIHQSVPLLQLCMCELEQPSNGAAIQPGLSVRRPSIVAGSPIALQLAAFH